MIDTSQPAIYSKVVTLISEVTGVDLDRVIPEAKLELDLAVDMTREFPLVVKQLNQFYEIDLDTDLFFEEYEEPTVRDLVTFTTEEVALS